MEEVIGLIVDALTKNARGQRPAPAPQPPNRPAQPRIAQRRTPAAPGPAPAAVPPAPPRPAPARSAPAAPADPFVAASAAPHPSAAGVSLLSAFTSRERLLAAIVLSEALGAPVALRNDNSLRSRDVLGPDVEN